MTAGYDVPAEPGDAEISVRHSRFVARAERAASRAEAMAAVARAEQAHPRARHHCWAFWAGDPGAGEAGSSDDGEPSGTAGRPILEVIQHHGMGDVVIVVSRYFGGIKLGAGGLIRAYARAGQAVLSQVPVARYQPHCLAELTLDFAHEHAVRQWLNGRSGAVEAVAYAQGVTMRLSVPLSDMDALSAFCDARGITCEPLERFD
jgi:uncharacterized YigZ family protein